MTYLIDGHNLIPKMPDLSLDQLDDEQELIDRLTSFSVSRDCQVEIYFDRGQVNSLHDYQRGRVHIHFVRPPMIADDAILARLIGIGKAAKNYTVVTNDQTVQNRARRLGAAILSSARFAGQIQESKKLKKSDQENVQTQTSQNEIDEWLEVFSKGRSKHKNT
jgi:predicted RNA-binding protein with PIN domain